jgi:hypothetical protein
MCGMMYSISTQRGAALIVFLLIALLGGSSFLLSKLLNSPNLFSSQYFQKQLQTEKNLAQAKAALLGYAVNYHEKFPGMYGFLPCPDYRAAGEEGQEDDCSLKPQGMSVLGKLPWKTLGLPMLRDDGHECLWYAVSGYHKDVSSGLSYELAEAAPPSPPALPSDLYIRESTRTNMLNDDTPGLFKIYHVEPGISKLATLEEEGLEEANNVVAVIIAPGKPLAGQDRAAADPTSACGGLYDRTQYLDDPGEGFSNQAFSEGIKTINQFFTANSTYQDQINDRLTYITRDELFQAIRKRSDFMNTIQDFTRIVTLAILDYVAINVSELGNQDLPWPSFYENYSDLPWSSFYGEYPDPDLKLYSDKSLYRRNDYGTDEKYNDFTNTEYLSTSKVLPLSVDSFPDFIDFLGSPDFPEPRPLSGRIPNIINVSNYVANWFPGSLTGPYEIFQHPAPPWPLPLISEPAVYLDPFPIISAYGFDGMLIDSAKFKKLFNSGQLHKVWTKEEFLAMWRNWKDHLFYVVSRRHRPDGKAEIGTCTKDTCTYFEQTITPEDKDKMTLEEQAIVEATTMPEKFAAAVVIFAGERLPGQHREEYKYKDEATGEFVLVSDYEARGEITNYLEGVNAESFNRGDGKGLYAQYNQYDIHNEWGELLGDITEDAFSCESKETCDDMISCEEVIYHFEICGNNDLLREKDKASGIPCAGDVCKNITNRINDILYCIFTDESGSLSVNYCKY